MRLKTIPEHIAPRWDETVLQWGLFNSRLQQWVGKDPDFGHAVFETPEAAKAWYRSVI